MTRGFDSERALAVFDDAPVGLAVATLDGVCVAANGRLAELLGVSVEWLVGRSLGELTHPDDRHGEREAFALLGAGAESFEREQRYVLGDGRTLRTLLRVRTIAGEVGEPPRLVASVKDLGAAPADDDAAHGELSDALDALSRSEAESRNLTAELDALGRIASAPVEGGVAALAAVVARELAELLGLDHAAVMRESTLLGSWPAATGAASAGAASAPIEAAGHAWGTLIAGPSSRAAAGQLDARLARFARLIGPSLANAEARARLVEHATTDGLTGLANMRAFSERLHGEVERARRYGRSLSVVMIDVDRFRSVNDTHGRAAGDRLLAELAACLRAAAREGELVARVGGEEFAWILPEADGSTAYAAADRVRRLIDGHAFAELGSISLSAGTCDLIDGRDADGIVRLADRALDWAKDNGGNIVFRYHPEMADAIAARAGAAPDSRAHALAGIRSLARAVDGRQLATQHHSERVAALAEQLALALGWTAGRARLLYDAALVHDVGRLGVAESILRAPGQLSSAERVEVELHPELGARIASEALEPEQVEWIRHHRERFDGGGYPHGLAGAEIPDGALLLGLADAWDAMTTDRTYRTLRAPEDALAECRRAGGSQFAPTAIDGLERLWRLRHPALVAADALAERLRGEQPEGGAKVHRVLFLSPRNSSRSQMAQLLFEQACERRHEARSAGSAAADEIDPLAVAAMREVGLDVADRVPHRLDALDVQWAEVVVLIGIGEGCPAIPGTRLVEWDVDDAGEGLDGIRRTRDEIARRAAALVAELDADDVAEAA